MADYATNRKARFNYEIVETFEAGLVLAGFEVKAVKKGQADIETAFVTAKGSELLITNMLIAPYQKENIPQGYNPDRPRKILLHKKEIQYLTGKMRQAKLSLIPLRLYGKGKRNIIKIEIAMAKGKRKSDKRETIKKRQAEREIKRTIKSYA